MRQRAQAIIIRDRAMLFAYGIVSSNNELRHSFIGGGIEQGETPEEAVLRELREEAHIEGRIIFKFNREIVENHHTFLIHIGNQSCRLGTDPEEEHLALEERNLKDLIWILFEDRHLFTSIDKEYIERLIEECKEREYYPEWIDDIQEISLPFRP
ncbi:NUDIX hydrolase [Paenibacillus terrigena]|uniref:NUDIX hydrolase n=1 Tax=Paenibacillus terrigena TaxID=369333 RepID=UPI0003670A9F|nr:NUDIX domain-containing protein [Paenibacillus terrigena]